MDEEYQNVLLRLPKRLIKALESEARQTNRRYRSPQLEQILSERYDEKETVGSGKASTPNGNGRKHKQQASI